MDDEAQDSCGGNIMAAQQIEAKEVITSTYMCSRIKENFNKATESTDSLTRENKVPGKSAADSVIKVV